MKVVLVPGTPLLLPEHSSQSDPVGPLRAAIREAVATLSGDVVLVGVPDAHRSSPAVGTGEPVGLRVGRALLSPARAVVLPDEVGEADAVLLVADGSARRLEEGGPGEYDARAADFDRRVADALAAGDPAALAALDGDLADELMVAGLPGLRWLGGLPTPAAAALAWSGAPYGVGYFVATWTW